MSAIFHTPTVPPVKRGRGRPRKTLDERDEWSKAQATGHSWDLVCRYCGFHKNILHAERVALENADSVFLANRHKHLQRLARKSARALGTPTNVVKNEK